MNDTVLQDFTDDILAVQSIKAVPTILDVVCRTTGMGFAAVARVTEDRWITCSAKDDIAFGLEPGCELEVATTICHEIRQSGTAVVIDHVAGDATYRNHPTPAKYGFQSYISMPILMPDGSFFGTLCAIDPKPAKLRTPEIVGMFKMFAELIAMHLDAYQTLRATGARLLDEQRTSTLREQFIAVLGHDLRNPLTAISGGVQIIGRTRLDEKAAHVLPMVRASVARMAGLIDNLLDFARGRLGGGLTLNRAPCDLVPVLEHLVTELQTSQPERRIETRFALDGPVDCDAGRLSQLTSNLLANALTYGAPDRPVIVRAANDASGFELSVSNGGEPISPLTLDHLFEPFERGAVKPSQQGLGLGLYIASRIATAHGGTLAASSTADETRFTFRMPA